MQYSVPDCVGVTPGGGGEREREREGIYNYMGTSSQTNEGHITESTNLKKPSKAEGSTGQSYHSNLFVKLGVIDDQAGDGGPYQPTEYHQRPP